MQDADRFANFAIVRYWRARCNPRPTGSIYVTIFTLGQCRTYRFSDHAPWRRAQDYSVFSGPRIHARQILRIPVPPGFDGYLKQAKTDALRWVSELRKGGDYE